MPNYGNKNIVSDGYGPPHYYGDTIWDAFRPNPANEQDLQQNLYSQGYLGDQVDQIQEQGSPFRRLLQGIGVMNAPEPRALTPYEQYLYQRGQHTRGAEDQKTEQERIQLLQSEENLGQDVAKTGQLPSGAPWNLPQEMMPGFENIQKDYGQTADYIGKKRQMDLENEQSLIDKRNKYDSQLEADRQEQRHLQNLAKWGSMPPVKQLMAEYSTAMKEAGKELNPEKQSAILARAAQIQQRMQRYFNSVAVPTGELSPADVSILTNMGTDVFAPFQRESDNRIVQTPEDVDKALKQMGLSSQQFPFGAP